MVATVLGLALLVNIFQRKQEARNPFFRVVELTDDTVDPSIWGKNFPLQYDDYLKTTDQVRTRYGGSEAEPRTPYSSRSPFGCGPVATRRRSAAQNHVGRICVFERLPGRTRSRIHARRPNVHRASAGYKTARHMHQLSRLSLRRLQAARRW